MSHHKLVCVYGFTHGQCRCPSKDKEIKIIECNMTNAHAPLDGEDESVVDFLSEVKSGQDAEETLHARLDAVLRDHFWWLADEARNGAVGSLEEAVKDWLIEAANDIRRDNDTSVQRGGTGNRRK